MSTPLDRIAAKATADRQVRFTPLAHVLTPAFLTERWRQLNRRGASGIDGATTQPFERERETRVQDSGARLQAGTYRAPPGRRVAIPTGPGTEGPRPRGMPTVEDRQVQRAVARLRDAVFEGDVRDGSSGCRPGRSPHQALRALRGPLVTKKVRQLCEADRGGGVDHLTHQWWRPLVAHRMAEPVIWRVRGTGRRAGVMQGGVVTRTAEGTPPGGPISPVLAHGYRHGVLDRWVEKKFRPWCQGEAVLTRCADDGVASFQDQRDAEAFHRQRSRRVERFNLALAEEKPRLLRCGRFARARKAEYAAPPESCDGLGFKHVGGIDRSGTFAWVRIPSSQRCRKLLASPTAWRKSHRHWKRREQPRPLTMRLGGVSQSGALHHCPPKRDGVWCEVQRQWMRARRRRSQRPRRCWSDLTSRAWVERPDAATLHPTV